MSFPAGRYLKLFNAFRIERLNLSLSEPNIWFTRITLVCTIDDSIVIMRVIRRTLTSQLTAKNSPLAAFRGQGSSLDFHYLSDSSKCLFDLKKVYSLIPSEKHICTLLKILLSHH